MAVAAGSEGDVAEAVIEMRLRGADPRSQRSRQLLKAAAIHLLRKGSDPQPSVSTLVRTAQVSRSTFYAHYDSVDELLDDALGEVLRFAVPLTDGPLGFVPGLFAQVEQQPELAAAMLSADRNTDLAPRLRHQIARSMASGGYENSGLAGEVMADGLLAALRWWLDVCPERPAREMATEFIRLWSPALAACCGGLWGHALD